MKKLLEQSFQPFTLASLLWTIISIKEPSRLGNAYYAWKFLGFVIITISILLAISIVHSNKTKTKENNH
ncbi:hypothetical protein EII25_06920 [Erysipelotrichaceae bacterium OH741_COT-311]|nr:hypothetical protein EII25_06920 [Erysipelotrichaceae bacterium OH741_COT-311]